MRRMLGAGTVAVVQGATGGLGFEFTHLILSRYPQTSVIALSRQNSLQSNSRLMKLKEENPERLHLEHCDLSDPSTIEQAALEVRSKYLLQDNKHVGLLINASGILHNEHHMPEKSIKELDPDWLTKTFQVNTIGPMLLAKAFSPWMIPPAAESEEQSTSVIACLSARVGSISDNKLGGWYSYRMSKAALNMGIRNLSLELKTRTRGKVICVALHPGTVKTGLSQPFQKGIASGKLFDSEFAAGQLLDVIASLDPSKDNGSLLSYDGTQIPW
eukprot:TRINITY_DN16217_c0_g2_i1.p1 TRINITY_DN16217_c0_g2~~TRINITY_DN16217_c0_g2_i1.p1  ORF type:complete len:272 (-),score=63.44 TRINITY_DN16217_c0_g2_i1:62-877(-)